MVPIRLEITNFMSYQGHHELDFTGFKTASIVGNNGSGKSAILDAITWALFGKSRITKDTERKDNVRERNDVINCYSSFCQVSLEFELEGKRYFVNRRIDRGKSGQGLQFKLLADGGEVDLHGKGASDAEIERELGVSFKVFLTSSFITQGDSSRFMDASPKERREMLAEILELDIYERCLEQTAEMSRETKKNKEILEDKQKTLTEATLTEQDTRRRLDLATTILEEATKALALAKNERVKITSELANLESQIAVLQADERKRNELLEEEVKLEKDIAKWNEEISKSKVVIEKTLEIEAGYSVFIQSKKDLEQLSEKAEKAHELEKKTMLLAKKIEIEENNLKNAHNQKKTELEQALRASHCLPELSENLEKARDEQTQLAKVVSMLSELELQLASALKDESNAKSNVESLKIKLNSKLSGSALASVDTAKIELESFDKLVNQLDEQQQLYENTEKQLNQCRLEIKLAKTETEHLKDEISLLEQGETGNCPLCGQTLEKERQLELMALKAKAIEELTAKVTTLDRESRTLAESLDLVKGNIAKINKQIARKPDILAIIQLSTELDEVAKQYEEYIAITKNLQYGKDLIIKENEALLSRKPDIEKSMLSANHSLEEAKKLAVNVDSLSVEASVMQDRLKTMDYAKEEQVQLLSLEKEKTELGFDPALLSKVREEYQKTQIFEEKKKLLERARDYVETTTPALIQASDRLNGVKNAVMTISEKISSLHLLTMQKTALDQSMIAMNQKEALLSSDRDTKLTQKNNLERDLEQSLNAKAELDEVSVKLMNTDRELKILEECKRMFGTEGIPSQILEGVIPELQEMANSILTDISQGRIGSEGMRLQIETSREGTTKTYKTLAISITDGQIRRPYELFSGGERFRADFAIRIALSQLLASRSGRRLRTLVIDEGFGTQDDEGIRRLIEAIEDISIRFDKVLVISHVDELKNAFEKQVIVRRNAETSNFEIV